MASGRLGRVDLPATTETDIYTVPADTLATVNLNVCNRAAAPRSVRIAIKQGEVPLVSSHYIEFDTVIPANGVLERTGLVLSAGEILVMYASDTGISVRAHGFEESV